MNEYRRIIYDDNDVTLDERMVDWLIETCSWPTATRFHTREPSKHFSFVDLELN